MNHKTDTQKGFIAVPLHSCLFRREGGTYYLRVRVPDTLRPLIKRTEIRKSLRTKNPKEATRKVKIESLKVDQQFAAAEAKLKGRNTPETPLSREEMIWHASRYFVGAGAENRGLD